MTVEHRLHFSLADILAITCECKQCGVRISTTPAKVSINGLRRCPVCAHEWMNDERTNDVVYIHAMARLLTALPSALKNEEGLGFRLSLEFSEPG